MSAGLTASRTVTEFEMFKKQTLKINYSFKKVIALCERRDKMRMKCDGVGTNCGLNWCGV
jgi:hypothetical protein